ncbi:UDP-N-acetylmuramoyl-tripeptide--D-alanyl-D-alanine ligase [Alkaliphilus peptidifermentans]|uniref:UDP-N-acetylmuramoyl-tripeptide--D-alanyl-D-alanine ligase n=1 Tax=Alkaliphilus peptidifermentans DSM 18978 TaxID=1120976 RepID=A0A1G5H9D4_9FIRM|nr:UDP-N-acetylmuramoyl-tripeptide--D-alanyl-D-alanine ligase [Alkaliphilus peptidifermentans]SCY60512.1 UDP-N-acetylmuramoyl-tripeptide--D-alanyl-D-alanine ligase [Alkaliphilus peptidifermentans DSM 18978]
MITRTLREIQEMIGGTGLPKSYEEHIVKGVSTDSRGIKPNQLFVPIIGDRFNGHHYIEKAVEGGAKAALWSRHESLPKTKIPLIFVDDTLMALQNLAKTYRQQLPVKIIGITGSNGKTSTKDILAGLLKMKYKTHKTFGNLNNHIGVPLTLLEMSEDTEIAVIEMGMSALGEIQLLTSIAAPNAAIITNIGEAHLDGLKTKDNILKAKLEILEGLKSNGLFVYSAEDAFLKKIPESLLKNLEVKTFGENSNYRPQLKGLDEEGIYFSLEEVAGGDFFLPMLGKHQMYNATAAIIVADYFDISLDHIKEGLLRVEATGGRNELIQAKDIAILNDSYKSNPLSLKATLETLYSLKGYRQKIAILGDMNGLGEAGVKLHQAAAADIDPNQIDYLFTIGQLSMEIASAAMGKFSRGKVIHCTSLQDLIDIVKEVIEIGAIVLIKGSREEELETLVDILMTEDLHKKGGKSA